MQYIDNCGITGFKKHLASYILLYHRLYLETKPLLLLLRLAAILRTFRTVFWVRASAIVQIIQTQAKAIRLKTHSYATNIQIPRIAPEILTPGVYIRYTMAISGYILYTHSPSGAMRPRASCVYNSYPLIAIVYLIHIYIYIYIYIYMCHGAGAKVGWIKEYRGLTFTM